MSVVVDSVTKRFERGGSPAAHDVSFTAPAGAITSLIGPSGAGKSTILRIVAGLEFPERGTICIDGSDCTERPARERCIGLVFQSYALFRNMTVRENVAFGLTVKKRPQREIDQRVDELLELVQLSDLAHRRPVELSGGQQQRVAFARALAIRPKVLLLDEPFGALDARVRRELRDWLTELHERTALTTLLVTHDQEEALEVSAHVVVMLDGKVAQVGRPDEIYDRPASPAVASFLGAHRWEGSNADAYARPEELTLSRGSTTHVTTGTARTGRVERVRLVGSRVKVTCVLASGSRVTVDVARREFGSMGIAIGDQVFVDAAAARVFAEDFAI